jgi:serine/threonine protein kinase/Tol biopolymer transport system component
MTIEPGLSLSNYRIVDALGVGGMGEVWRAEDEKLGRQVALKVLPEEFAQDPERMARFEREAKVLASLNHPNIATLYGLETVVPHPGVIPSEAEGLPSVIPSERSESRDPLKRENAASPRHSTGISGDPSTPASLHDASAQDDREKGADAPLTRDDSQIGAEATSSPEPQAAGPPVTFLAMELVEGEDLSERIKRGVVPLEETTAIALQIAEALEAAHEQGIVHRDLKPANIKLRPDGTVKVLDFGLAKAWDANSDDSNLSKSPTLTAHATAAGVIIGTAAYMSPEQAAGIAADRRADIWAFGVVLWEMLTGNKLFEGETVSHVLASVLKDEADLDALPGDTPNRLRNLVARCLQKKPKQRLQAIGDARILLEEYRADPDAFDRPSFGTAAEAVPQPIWKKALPWAVAALAATAAVVFGVGALSKVDAVDTAIRFQVLPPDGQGFHLDSFRPGPVVVSPDGRSLAFAAWDADGQVRLFVRDLDEVQPRVLAGTEGSQYPFWSPDSKSLGFFADGKLKKVSASGGQPLTLCDASDGKGGTWGADGVILFAPAATVPIQRVSQLGGEPIDVTIFDEERGDESHRHPRFLPDGKHFLFLARFDEGYEEGHAVVAASLDADEQKVVARSPAAAEYASGHLLFLRERTLMAQPFDPDALELSGEPFPVADTVVLISTGTAQAVFSASQTGVLAFQGGTLSADLVLRWRGRDGATLETIGEPARFTDDLRLSPSEDTAMVQIRADEGANRDLWVVELDRKLRTRFTFNPNGDDSPIFSPDGETVMWEISDEQDGMALHRKSVGGSGDGEQLLELDKETWPASWHPSGDVVLLSRQVSEAPNNIDLLTWKLGEGSEPQPWLATEFIEYTASFSPDGRWVAYGSNESGAWEVYVAPFPGPGRKWQVSVGGGGWPQWRRDGQEILYVNATGEMMGVAVEERDAGLAFGEPQTLFQHRFTSGGPGFDVSADGERFLMVEAAENVPPEPVTVVVNWPAAIEAQR